MEFCDKIAPSFYQCLRDIEEHAYTHYWLKGGRSSAKSAFISLVMILNIMRYAGRNGIVYRKVTNTLRTSVFDQLLWAVDELGVTEYFTYKYSPLEITYKPNGNKILFRGLDDPLKQKSIKIRRGYFAYIWFEELAEFSNMEEIRSVLQSVMRGGTLFWCYYSYNPPESINAWVNYEAAISMKDRKVYHSTYLDVPREWLSDAFFTMAEHLKKINFSRYQHEYLGEVTGTGGEVFKNLVPRTITDEEIRTFDKVIRGLDWGYSVDPLAYITAYYDKTRKILYIFNEFYAINVSNSFIIEHIKQENPNNGLVRCDSAEPKSINQLYEAGIHAEGARKGAGSVEYGMKYLKDEIEQIIIDPKRCPNAYREFSTYEYDRDNYGNFKSRYPDHNNHTIDAVRYAMVDAINLNRYSW